MPSSIRDLSELTVVAPDDYVLISDTSDVVNRDKRISTTNLQLGVAKKTGTPVAGRVAGWLDANTVQDGGFALSDIARLSVAQSFTAVPTFTVGAIFGQGLAMAARAGMGGTAESLADQTAVLINTIGNSGVIVISSGNRANTSAIIAYRANASPFCNILCQPSTVFEVSTAILLGTTGTNGKVTFSATATAGQCYLENRLGASLSYIILRIS